MLGLASRRSIQLLIYAGIPHDACMFSGISGIVENWAGGGSSLVLCEAYEWPVFDLADSAIVVGAGSLVLENPDREV
jgi:lipoprotein signal peptidase